MSLVSLPFSFVFVAVYMPEDSLTMSFIVLPVALILGTVWPYLSAVTMSHVVHPLPLEFSFVLKDEFRPFFALAEIFGFALFTLVVPVVFVLAVLVIVLVHHPSQVAASDGHPLVHASYHNLALILASIHHTTIILVVVGIVHHILVDLRLLICKLFIIVGHSVHHNHLAS